MNTYSGVPETGFKALVESMQTKALEQQIRDAIKELTERKGGRYEAVIQILAALIGESDHL